MSEIPDINSYSKEINSKEIQTMLPSCIMNAKEKIIDYLQRRDHSEKELRTKLQKFDYTSAEIEAAFAWIKERNYLIDPLKLSQRHTERLQKQKKGQRYIQQYLKQRGLPPCQIDPDSELHNAIEFAKQIAIKNDTLDRKTREKIGRKLLSRGFTSDIVRKVIYEEL
jgi:regulatory protein